MTTSLGFFSDAVNFDALNLPLLACGADALGTYPKFLLNMLLPLFICLGIYKYADYKCDKMREKHPIPEGVHWKVSFRAKMKRGIVTSEIRGGWYNLIFFIIFMRYPGTSKKIFEMFSCRAVSATASLLEQDLTITCYEGAHSGFAALAAVFMILYPIGIPLSLFIFMRKYKSSITPTTDKEGVDSPGNPDFILVRPIKPIFQFYKPVNYNFELLFWVEKVVLTGVVGIGLGRIVALHHRSSNLYQIR